MSMCQRNHNSYSLLSISSVIGTQHLTKQNVNYNLCFIGKMGQREAYLQSMVKINQLILLIQMHVFTYLSAEFCYFHLSWTNCSNIINKHMEHLQYTMTLFFKHLTERNLYMVLSTLLGYVLPLIINPGQLRPNIYNAAF